MYRSFFAMALWLLAANVHAQFSLSGTVRDKNRILPGATVQVDDGKNGIVTDEFGRFQFSKLQAGQHAVRVKFLGYADNEQVIALQGNQNLDILLAEAVTMTDEVVVTATRAGENTPTTFMNVSRQAIQKQNFGQDLPVILNWTPSVVTTSDAGAGVGYTGIRIRGSDATRVNVMINGIPYNDSESQGTFWVDIPDIASSTQSIQIQRGVGTSTNGAGAFGASLNLQTNTLQSERYAELMAAAGSFNTRRYTLRAGTGLIGRWAFDGKLSSITSDGYIERASSDLGSYYVSAGYYGSKTIVKAIAFGGKERTYQAWYGVDGPTMAINRRMNYAGALYDANGDITSYYNNQVDDYKQNHYQLHLSQQLGEAWTGNASLHYTYGRGYYEEYHQLTTLGPMVTPADAVVRQWLDNKFYGATWSFNHDKEKNKLVIGGAYNEYGDAKHYGEIIWSDDPTVPVPTQYYSGTAQKNDFNSYAKWNHDLTHSLNTFIDLQYRYVLYKTSGIRDDQTPYAVDDTFNFFNPKIGLNWTLSDGNVLYGSYAVANREPNRSDYLDGDEKPRPERLGNFELGLRKSTKHAAFEINYYYMNYTDQLVLTGELNSAGYPIRANVGKSYRTGIELSGMLRLSPKWTWNLNATLSENKNKDYVVVENNVPTAKNTTIILSPGLIGGSQLSWSGINHLQVTWLSKYVGKQYLDNTQDESLVLSSYFINDLRFNYQLSPKGMKELGFSLLLNNIFDVMYSSNGYSYSGTAYYYPQAGRNFMAMMTLKF